MNASAMITCHATCVLVGSVGVLIRGKSGSGKSMLAASLISRGGRLVADDRVRLVARAGRLVALAPAPISGLLELRGIGPVSRAHEQAAIVNLVVDLEDPADVPRIPDREDTDVEIAGVAVGRLIIAAPSNAGSEDAALAMIDEAMVRLLTHKALHLPSVWP